MKNIYKILVFVFLFLINSNIYSQTYVNKEWEATTGNVGSIDRTASVLDNNEDLIVVSNTINAANNTDVLITKYDREGNVLWQKTYDGASHGDDYGVQVKVNGSNDIFVASSIYGTASNDFGLLKYAENGTLVWSNTWNGAANGIDVPADLDLDNIGNIYLVGGTEATNNMSDYAVVKFNPLGTVQWSRTYDYNNLHDAASSIKFDNNAIIVTGASASAMTNWDFATLKINATNGIILNIERTVATGVGLDNAQAVTTDANNNIYITGYVEVNGNANIQTVKLNNNFGFEWVKTFDGGFEDVAKAIDVDDFGNVYIAGSSENTNGGKDYITIKYDQAGTELWNNKYGASGGTNIAEAEKLAITTNGEVIIIGTLDKAGNKDFATIKYDANGKTKFIKEFDAGNLDDKASAISIKNDEIYVSGTSIVGMNKQNATVKYSVKEKRFELVYNGTKPSHNKNELVICFNKDEVNLTVINDLGFEAGLLSDFIKPNILDTLSEATEMNWGDLQTFKIFRRLTSNDSISISRTGELVKIPEFWATFSVMLPLNITNDSIIIHLLETHYPLIENVNRNSYGTMNGISDDPLIAIQQEGMIPTLQYPDGHININAAWDKQVGSSNIKVGVFDFGVYWAHEDFGDGTFNGSKVKGWDFETNSSISNMTTPGNNHGTGCAGIIGALRNNNIGVAGIAGGDFISNNTGVELYSMAIIYKNSFTQALVPTTTIIEAIVEGSAQSSSSNFGYGLDVQNHSWGAEGYNASLAGAIKFCWQNQCSFVASRGNYGNSVAQYPACYNDRWVINVGGSGIDGEYFDGTNGNYSVSTSGSSYGDNVDVIAPAVQELVATTSIGTVDCGGVNMPNYSCFSGTSSAAPHVAGVAALMKSQHSVENGYPNNLSSDDVEYLIQKNATDKSLIVGYDDKTGWGLLNASNTIDKVSGNYKVLHNSEPTSISIDPIAYNINISLAANMNGVSSGYYSADKYWVIHSYSEILNPTTTVIDEWARPSSTLGTLENLPIFDNNAATYQYNLFGNTMYVDAIMYCFFVKYNSIGQLVNKWVPDAPENLKSAFSLHLFDTNWTSIEEIEEQSLNFSVYPNPTDGSFILKYKLDDREDLNIEIVSSIGQLIYTQRIKNKQEGEVLINLSSFNKGIYFIKVKTKNASKIDRIILQ